MGIGNMEIGKTVGNSSIWDAKYFHVYTPTPRSLTLAKRLFLFFFTAEGLHRVTVHICLHQGKSSPASILSRRVCLILFSGTV